MRFHLAFASLLLLAPASLADEIVFKNGEKLIGKIEKLVDGKITIDSKSLGKVTVDFDKVDTFTSEEPIEIHLKDGTVVKQKVTAAGPGVVSYEKPGVVEPQSVPLAQVAKLNPPPVVWTGSFSASAIITRGNSDTNSASAELKLLRQTDDDRVRAEAFWISARQKDDTTGNWETTARSIEGLLQYDYFFSKKLYGYVNTKAKKDGPADLDLRFQAGAGVGYQWANQDDFHFSTEGGLTWISEYFSNATPDNGTLAARLAYRIDGKPINDFLLFHDFEIVDGFDEAHDYIIAANAGLRANLSSQLFAEAKVKYDYDRSPAIGAETTDVKYIIGVGLTF